jgi:hypothetical protein
MWLQTWSPTTIGDQHLKGLADASRVAKIDLQFAALGVLGRRHGGKLMGENSHVDSFGGANEA